MWGLLDGCESTVLHPESSQNEPDAQSHSFTTYLDCPRWKRQIVQGESDQEQLFAEAKAIDDNFKPEAFVCNAVQ